MKRLEKIRDFFFRTKAGNVAGIASLLAVGALSVASFYKNQVHDPKYDAHPAQYQSHQITPEGNLALQVRRYLHAQTNNSPALQAEISQHERLFYHTIEGVSETVLSDLLGRTVDYADVSYERVNARASLVNRQTHKVDSFDLTQSGLSPLERESLRYIYSRLGPDHVADFKPSHNAERTFITAYCTYIQNQDPAKERQLKEKMLTSANNVYNIMQISPQEARQNHRQYETHIANLGGMAHRGSVRAQINTNSKNITLERLFEYTFHEIAHLILAEIGKLNNVEWTEQRIRIDESACDAITDYAMNELKERMSLSPLLTQQVILNAESSLPRYQLVKINALQQLRTSPSSRNIAAEVIWSRYTDAKPDLAQLLEIQGLAQFVQTVVTIENESQLEQQLVLAQKAKQQDATAATLAK